MKNDVSDNVEFLTIYSRINTNRCKYLMLSNHTSHYIGPIAQSVASWNADLRVTSSILALSHTIVEIDLEIISIVILLLLLIQEGLLSVSTKVYAQSTR